MVLDAIHPVGNAAPPCQTLQHLHLRSSISPISADLDTAELASYQPVCLRAPSGHQLVRAAWGAPVVVHGTPSPIGDRMPMDWRVSILISVLPVRIPFSRARIWSSWSS